MLPIFLVGAALADEPAPRWTVQVDPLTAAIGFAHVQVERALSPHSAVYLGPHLHVYDGILFQGQPFRGYGVEAGYRWFFRPTAPEGLWAEARGVLAALHTTDGTEERAPGGYGSLLVGYTWIPVGPLVLAGGAGAQYIHYSVLGYGAVGVIPALHTAVGVAF